MGGPENLSFSQQFIVYLLFLWSLLWKGIALWRASANNQRNWFIAILILNTIGILEMIYLFRFAKKRMTIAEIREGIKKIFYTKSNK